MRKAAREPAQNIQVKLRLLCAIKQQFPMNSSTAMVNTIVERFLAMPDVAQQAMIRNVGPELREPYAAVLDELAKRVRMRIAVDGAEDAKQEPSRATRSAAPRK